MRKRDDDDDAPVKRGPGRPLGSINRLAKEAREAARQSGKLPHEILLDIARGFPVLIKDLDPTTGEFVDRWVPTDLDRVIEAAGKAAPYFAPKISTVEVIQGVSDADLDQIIARAAAEAGLSFGDVGEGTQGEEAEAGGSATGTDAPELTGQQPRRRVRLNP